METLQRTANRGSISTGYDIDNSLKLEADNSQYIDDRHYTAGNRKKLTISFWFKRTELGQAQMPYEQSSLQARIYLRPTDDLYITAFENSGWTIITNRLFRDSSAWYHCVFQLDTTQSTAADRMKLWINGQQETSFSSASYPTQNADTYFNTNQSAKVGGGGAGLYFSGYMSEFFFIDDQALQASDFGEYDSDSGIWIPKEYDGTFGGQSYYLEFKNASNLADRSDGLSNGVNLSVQNITSADQATDTPTNNFCTLNVISAIGNNTYTEGATKGIANAQNEQAEGTFMINKGKWYFEAQNITSTGAMFGFGKPNNWATGNPNNPGNDTSSFALANDGNVYYNSNTAASGWSTNATTDKVMIAIDLDNGFCYFGKNGTWGNSGDPTSGSSGTGGFNYVSLVTNISLGDELVPALRISYTQTHGAMFNFGGYTIMTISSAASDANGYGTFEYAPPSGYYALCTKNLAEYG
jgi:hypothetical protein